MQNWVDDTSPAPVGKMYRFTAGCVFWGCFAFNSEEQSNGFGWGVLHRIGPPMRPCEASQIEGHNSHIGCHAFSQCDVYSNLSIPMRQRLMEPCLSPSKLSHRHGSILGIALVGLAGLDPRGRRAHPMGEGGGGARLVGWGLARWVRRARSSRSVIGPRLVRRARRSYLYISPLMIPHMILQTIIHVMFIYKMIYNFTYNSAYNFTYTPIQFLHIFTHNFACNSAHKLYIYVRL